MRTPEFPITVPDTNLLEFTSTVIKVAKLPRMFVYGTSTKLGIRHDNLVHAYLPDNQTRVYAGEGKGSPDLITECFTSPASHWEPTDQYRVEVVNSDLLKVELTDVTLEEAVKKYLAANRHWWQRLGHQIFSQARQDSSRNMTQDEIALYYQSFNRDRTI
jgi:hypothetical protein